MYVTSTVLKCTVGVWVWVVEDGGGGAFLLCVNNSLIIAIIIRQYSSALLCFSLRAKWKRSLAPVDIPRKPVDRFLKFNRILEAEKILHNLYNIDT